MLSDLYWNELCPVGRLSGEYFGVRNTVLTSKHKKINAQCCTRSNSKSIRNQVVKKKLWFVSIKCRGMAWNGMCHILLLSCICIYFQSHNVTTIGLNYFNKTVPNCIQLEPRIVISIGAWTTKIWFQFVSKLICL